MQIHLDVEDNIPQPAIETQQLLLRATSEMLFNIIKHAQTKHAELSLTLSENNHYLLKVEDYGIGISDHKIGSLSGLGLLSIRQRAQWLGGSLQIEKIDPQGTRILLKLPA